MITSETDKDTTRPIRAEASIWLAKLHGPERCAELEAEFRRWLTARPENAQAFEQITKIWEALPSVDLGGVPRIAPAAALERKPRWQRFAQVAVACSVVAACAVVWLMRGTSYSTDIGEQRVVSLEDGSRLSLNSGTSAEISYADDERVVRLRRGEAFFEVAADATRPFVVIAGDKTVTALGTSFVVRHDNDAVSVTLVEGKVVVAPLGASSSAGAVSSLKDESMVKLQPGERLRVDASQAQRIDTPSLQAVTAWRRGEVELDYTRLQDTIDELNRYDRESLVLDTPGIGELPISGIYRIGRNEDFARAIAVVYGLDVARIDGRIHLRKH